MLVVVSLDAVLGPLRLRAAPTRTATWQPVRL